MPLNQFAFIKNTQQFWIKHLLVTLLLVLFMLNFYPSLRLDTRLTDIFFNAQLNDFPLKHHPLLAHWAHAGLKWLMVGIALVSLCLFVIANQYTSLQPHKKSFLWVFLGMVLSTGLVAVIKHYNQHACPWDTTLYGGDLPLFELFSNAPLGFEAGRCFPAGHPSGGFALMAFYFAFLQSQPRFANTMLWLGVSMGLLMGFAQIMRGAHFLSHVLWSGLTVWSVLLFLYAVWRPKTAHEITHLNHQASLNLKK